MRKEPNRGVRVWAADGRFTRFVSLLRQRGAQLLIKTGHRRGVADVFLVGNDVMRTNVLSFPAARPFPRPDLAGKFLGEIYLNPLYIEKRGEDLHYMLIHGFLHLLGYDHARRDGRIAMERKERALMKMLERD